MDLAGRRALVTGGNRGIGLEAVRQLRDLGITVILGSRDAAAGTRAATNIGEHVTSVQLDVANPASVARARDRVGTVDILINNAAVNPRDDTDTAIVEEAWQINYLGAWRVHQAFIGPMREAGWGRIVNVSTGLAASAAERRGGGVYPETKVALNALTRALAEDLADTGILINAISPGWCRTDMGGGGASRSAVQGAASIVWGVTLPDEGPTGGFYYDGEPLPW
jgi:NAD(P)-dependent dehydrogenase (short-subunit alcohol dehydrogenase family)